jgi:hypothetical protein
MALPFRIRYYVVSSIEGIPAVLSTLLGSIPSDSAYWDDRPFAERFTPREVIAHLADWNPIFEGRIRRMITEDNPEQPDIDEGEVALANDYAHQDPQGTLLRFVESRRSLSQLIGSLTEAQWIRVGRKEPLGELTVSDLVTLIAGHDGYHARQFAEYLG